MREPSQSNAIDRWRGTIAAAYRSKPEHLIPILQLIQEQEGYLSPEAMQAAARYLRMPASKVYGVASFYAQFNFTPQGRNKLTVCRGTACHVRGSGPLLRDMERTLGVSAGETTEDLSFTLETVACFGACALAPVVVLNGVVHRQQTTAGLRRLVQAAGKVASGPARKGGAKKAAPRKAAGAKKAAPKAKRADARRSKGRRG